MSGANETLTAIKDAGAIVMAVGGLLFALLFWRARGEFVRRDDFKDFHERHEEDHKALESRLAQGATHFAELDASIKESERAREQLENTRLEMVALKGQLALHRALLERIDRGLSMMVQGHLKLPRGDEQP